MSLRGISSAMGCALYGINGSIQRLDAAASEVVREGAAMSDSATFSSEALAKAGANGPQAPEASLERGLVNQRVALHELRANISVIRTADEMADALTRIGDSSRR